MNGFMDGIIAKHYGMTEKWIASLKDGVNYLRNSQLYIKYISKEHQRFLFKRVSETHSVMSRAAVMLDRELL